MDHVFSSTQRASQVKNRIAVVLTDGKSQDDVVSETLAQSRIGSLKCNNLNLMDVSAGGRKHGGAS